jgi:hypothetical protein
MFGSSGAAGECLYKDEVPYTCALGEFSCNNGECIPDTWECDGIKNFNFSLSVTMGSLLTGYVGM